MNWQNKIAEQVGSIPRSGIREFFDLVTGRSDIISLGVGEPDFVTPWNMREAAIYSLERVIPPIHPSTGWNPCAVPSSNTWTDFPCQLRSLREVLVTVGVSEAIDLALRAILNPGDEVLYHEPCYVSYAPSVNMAYGVATAVPTSKQDLFALNPAVLEAAITPRTKVLMLNFPTNPTGAVAPVETLQEIARICIKHDLIVLTDEIYSELRYDGKPHVSIAALPGMRERTLLLQDFQAFAMTGFRLGYACGPEPLISAMMASSVFHALLYYFPGGGHWAMENGSYVEDAGKLRQRRDYLVSALMKSAWTATCPAARSMSSGHFRFSLTSKVYHCC
ncbi:MAG: pyridoxal phosphate-dependent aminotransferase [Akkermansia sp.]